MAYEDVPVCLDVRAGDPEAHRRLLTLVAQLVEHRARHNRLAQGGLVVARLPQ